jgi:Tol biopolymer transport system component
MRWKRGWPRGQASGLGARRSSSHFPVRAVDLSIIDGFALADADGSNRTRVQFAPPPSSSEQPPGFLRVLPSFGPDGTHFAYVRASPQAAEIWRATVDGSEDRRLAVGDLPRWSPDGRTIAYVRRNWDPVRQRIRELGTWLMSARTGRRLRRLWGPSAHSLDWAPGGRRLVASRSGSDLFILRRDGTNARRLIPGPPEGRRRWHDREPAWSPDGRRIAFVRERSVPDDEYSGELGTQQEIWTIGTHGSRARRIWERLDGFDSDAATPTLSWQSLPSIPVSREQEQRR